MTTTHTIDKLPASDHLRYAEGQVEFDPKFVREAFIGDLAAAPEITNGYITHLDLIFGTHIKNISFAHFAEPPKKKTHKKRKRKHKLFSRRGLLGDLFDKEVPEDVEELPLGEGGVRDKEQMAAFLKDVRYIDAMVLEAYGKIDRLQLG